MYLFEIIILLIGKDYLDRSLLMGTVRIKESACYIYDILSSPGNVKSGFLSNRSDFNCLKVFFGGVG